MSVANQLRNDCKYMNLVKVSFKTDLLSILGSDCAIFALFKMRILMDNLYLNNVERFFFLEPSSESLKDQYFWVVQHRPGETEWQSSCVQRS